MGPPYPARRSRESPLQIAGGSATLGPYREEADTMRSMTGIGSGMARRDGVALRVEIRSVNHRFLDVVVRAPSAFAEAEAGLRQTIADAIDRGRVTVNVELERRTPEVELRVNESFVADYVKRARALAKRHRLPEDIALTQILAHPEAMSVREKQLPQKLLHQLLEEATDQALNRFQSMRDKEGRALAKELQRRLKTVDKFNKQVRKNAAAVPKELRTRLEERLRKLGAADAVDPQRLAAEVALLADKATVAEEVERLDSHLVQFEESVRSGEPVAKRLGFLLQEMHREVNTMGSKSTHLAITDAVLRMKEEIENLREQIQNLE